MNPSPRSRPGARRWRARHGTAGAALATALILTLARAAAAASYRGLEPGRSSRAEAERTLGAPARSAAGLSQHRAADGTRVYLRYAATGETIERVDVLLVEPLPPDRARVSLGLGAAGFSRLNPEGQLEEGFAASAILLTHASADAASAVERIAYLTPAAIAALAPGGSSPAPPAAATPSGRPATPPVPPRAQAGAPTASLPDGEPDAPEWSIRDVALHGPAGGWLDVLFVLMPRQAPALERPRHLLVPVSITCPGAEPFGFSWNTTDVEGEKLGRSRRIVAPVPMDRAPRPQRRVDCTLSVFVQDDAGVRSNTLSTTITLGSSRR